MTVPSWKTGSVYLNLLTGERLETITQGERQVLPSTRSFNTALWHCSNAAHNVGSLGLCKSFIPRFLPRNPLPFSDIPIDKSSFTVQSRE